MESALEVQRKPAMKQNTTRRESPKQVLKQSVKQSPKQSPRQSKKNCQGPMAIGMDLGDRTSRYCVLNDCGEVVKEASAATTKKGLAQVFAALKRSRIAIEVGTHSPWVSRLLKSLGHEVFVANPRQVKLISQSSRKNDRVDARTLARLVRVDPELLRPIQHRSEEMQMDLMVIRVRAALVEARTQLVNSARGLAKSVGERLPKCDARSIGSGHLGSLPKLLQDTLEALLLQVEALSVRIEKCDRQIEQIARTKYPETKLLQQVSGVGPLIALTFVLTVADKQRFQKSRDVGCYLGLRPKRSQSGQSEPELRITKEGDVYMRKLLVQGAHYILGRKGPDTDLKRWGARLAVGGKRAKKRAVVAVARKLAILLHKLWSCGEVYEPLRNSPARQVAA
jgi:transposase